MQNRLMKIALFGDEAEISTFLSAVHILSNRTSKIYGADTGARINEVDYSIREYINTNPNLNCIMEFPDMDAIICFRNEKKKIFENTSKKELFHVIYDAATMTPASCFDIIKGKFFVCKDLVSKVNNKGKFLFFALPNMSSCYFSLPKDIIYCIAQEYVKQEFTNKPLSLDFFRSEKNVELIKPKKEEPQKDEPKKENCLIM